MKKILVVFPYFYPAYKAGGPIRSATNLIKLLSGFFSFKLFTSDRDLGDVNPFADVNVNSWNNSYYSVPVYYSSSPLKMLNIKHAVRDEFFDTLYLNSFFNYEFAIKFILTHRIGWLKCNRIILAPRGELSIGAMSLKPSKKRLYLLLFKFFGFHKKIIFHFTSEDELQEAISYLGDVNYLLAPNMHGAYPSFKEKEKKTGQLNILFLSRISPKKNLLMAINALKDINFGEINFTIAGAIDDAKYWELCQTELKFLSKNIKIKFIGPVAHEDVSNLLMDSHLFILPTLNENYGHAIVEAMVHSNIVLISDKTPWSKVMHSGSYVVGEKDIGKYREYIIECMNLDRREFNEKSSLTYCYCDFVLKNNIFSIKKIFD